MAPTNNQDDRRELQELNVKIGEAEKGRDADFLRTVLADDLYFRRASGVVVDRATYLVDLAKPENTYEYLVSEDVAVTVYESTAVASLRVRAKGTKDNTPFEGVYRNTRLFLKQPEGWRCAVWFNTRIEPPQDA
jgi:hypothetical protein